MSEEKLIVESKDETNFAKDKPFYLAVEQEIFTGNDIEDWIYNIRSTDSIENCTPSVSLETLKAYEEEQHKEYSYSDEFPKKRKVYYLKVELVEEVELECGGNELEESKPELRARIEELEERIKKLETASTKGHTFERMDRYKDK
jgi:hypothetical protein